MKQYLHTIRKQIDDLFYILFDDLNQEQREAFANVLANIDYQIKSTEEF